MAHVTMRQVVRPDHSLDRTKSTVRVRSGHPQFETVAREEDLDGVPSGRLSLADRQRLRIQKAK